MEYAKQCMNMCVVNTRYSADQRAVRGMSGRIRPPLMAAFVIVFWSAPELTLFRDIGLTICWPASTPFAAARRRIGGKPWQSQSVHKRIDSSHDTAVMSSQTANFCAPFSGLPSPESTR